MDLNTLRQRVLTRVGLSAATDLPQGLTRIDEALNRQWRYNLPTLIMGTARKGFVTFNTIASSPSYDLENTVGTSNLMRSITGPFMIQDDIIDFYTDPEAFYKFAACLDCTDEGKPRICLVLGHVVTFRPIPDAAYTITVFCHKNNAALTSSGIADDIKAEFVWLGAAGDIALHDLDDEETAGKAYQAQQVALTTLNQRYALFRIEAPPVQVGDQF